MGEDGVTVASGRKEELEKEKKGQGESGRTATKGYMGIEWHAVQEEPSIRD